MADWTKAMTQTFEYYVVDPDTWKDTKKINTVKSCSISRDYDTNTLGSATLEVVDLLGECYIRIYLVVVQNGLTERFPLGTFLVQTPSSSFDGKIRSVSMDAYTPLIELKENYPSLGYCVLKDSNIMDIAYRLTSENTRAPVVSTICDKTLNNNFVSNVNDTWMTFLTDLLSNAKYKFDLDELGRILFSPEQDTASLQPVWTYNDDNSSILYPDISLEHDLYGIPNVVEVIYSDDTDVIRVEIKNEDNNSPTSIQNRGRRITHRVTNPELGGKPTELQLKEYATRLLKELSSIEYSVSYSHGYCPVRVGDCVRLNYTRAGLPDVKARVVSQTIKCDLGCSVSEKAVFTTKLWR